MKIADEPSFSSFSHSLFHKSLTQVYAVTPYLRPRRLPAKPLGVGKRYKSLMVLSGLWHKSWKHLLGINSSTSVHFFPKVLFLGDSLGSPIPPADFVWSAQWKIELTNSTSITPARVRGKGWWKYEEITVLQRPLVITVFLNLNLNFYIFSLNSSWRNAKKILSPDSAMHLKIDPCKVMVQQMAAINREELANHGWIEMEN